MSAWDELIRTEADIRKKRQQMIYAQQERRRQLLEIIAVIGLVAAIGAFLFFVVYLYINQ